MAIYHLEAKVVSRGTGRSAVAASAYLSCTNILNDYDGVRHDYTRKKGLIWRGSRIEGVEINRGLAKEEDDDYTDEDEPEDDHPAAQQ